MTLIEILVALVIALLLAGGMAMGVGALANARMRASTTMIAGAIRIAYNHANSTSRPTRVVFDLAERTVSIEDSEGRMLIQSGDRTGGAAGATELEKELVADAETIVEGPHAPRPEFSPVKKLLGFQDPDTGLAIRKLESGIYFKQVEVAHQDEPVTEERAYIYFWPGGQTELGAVQLQQGNGDQVEDGDVSTVLVAPLTGKVQVKRGPVDMPKPPKDGDVSEREDTG